MSRTLAISLLALALLNCDQHSPNSVAALTADLSQTAHGGSPISDTAADSSSDGDGLSFDPFAAPLLESGGQGSTTDVPRSQWKAILPHDTSPIDVSFLNHKPAGKFGFVVRDGDSFKLQNGVKIKFWGANVVAHAIFRTDAIKRQAKRLARLGYNLVRIHHHDSTGWVSPTVIDKSKNDSRSLDVAGIDALDQWIAALASEGIYTFLDIHVGRKIKAGDKTTELGTIATYDELDDNEVKGFCQYDSVLQKLMVEFQEKYLSHVNSYRSKAYKDDAAIAGILITNENDITHHFGNSALPDKNNPALNGLFNNARKAFAQATGLSESKLFETWLPGESKIFLNNQEHLFNQTMLTSLSRLEVQVPVATTNSWGPNPAYSLPALTDGSLIDVHAYEKEGFLSANPRTTPINAHWVAAAQVAGFPVSITEWNVVTNSGKAAADSYAGPMFMAAIGALQGWDAPMLYTYSAHQFSKPSKMLSWSTFADPRLQAITPAAALAFRQKHIHGARSTHYLDLDRDRLYFEAVSPKTSAAIRTLTEQSRLLIGLPDIAELSWDRATTKPPGAVSFIDHTKDYLASDKSHIESDTGEIRRYWGFGIQTINTAETQCAQGRIGGWKIPLGHVTFEIKNPEAAVVVSSLDGKKIGQSSRILITAVARVASNSAEAYVSEPVIGDLTITARPGLQLVPIKSDGGEGPAVSSTYKEGDYVVRLTASSFSHWYLLR